MSALLFFCLGLRKGRSDPLHSIAPLVLLRVCQVMNCLDENLLARLADGHLNLAALTQVEEHLDSCGDCAELAACFGQATASGDDVHEFLGGEITPGDHIGRYQIRGWLGRGAMGQVYVARDPSLDREVALKLVSAEGHEELETRLAAEARAMAKLSDHANVVSVYDVGKAGRRTFVAMELVRGTSLERRLAEQTLPWRKILAHFIAAGRGLQAAHEAEVVHRDFKPSNVLIRQDGAIKVGDFGLATLGHVSLNNDCWPKASTAAGTPAYMSPEQHRGERAGSPSDQFSFALALWEALYGERPFAGKNSGEIRGSVLAGECRPAPRSSVPDQIARILGKALAPDPADRYPEMGALLNDLERFVRPKRWPWLAAGGSALVLLALFATWRITAQPLLCPGADARVVSAWNAAAIESQLSAAPRPYAKSLTKTVISELGGYGDRWVSAQQVVCQATHVSHEQSPALLDQRMHCLDRRLQDFKGLATLLAERTDVIDSALEAVEGLRAPEGCIKLISSSRDGATLQSTEPEIDAELSRLGAELSAGRYREALSELEALEKERPPTEVYNKARLEALRGQAQTLLFQSTAAEASLRSAALLAAETGDSQAVASAWTLLIHVVGVQQGNYQAGLIWADAAERELLRQPDDVGWQALFEDKALLLHELGNTEEANRLAARALEIAKANAELSPLRYASALNLQAAFWRADGRLDEAERAFHSVIEIRSHRLGSEHPMTARARVELAKTMHFQGDLESSLTTLQQAIDDLVAVFGPESSQTVNPRLRLAKILISMQRMAEAEGVVNALKVIVDAKHGDTDPRLRVDIREVLGRLYKQQGRLADAILSYREALAIAIAHFGTDDHPTVANLQTSLGTALLLHDQLDEAETLLSAALRTQEKSFGKNSSNLAPILHYLGEIRLSKHDCPGAKPYLERSAQVIERDLGADHFNMSFPLIALGNCQLLEHDKSQAIALLERALAIREAREGAVLAVVETEFNLARAYFQNGEKSRGVTLARKALGRLEGVEGSDVAQKDIQAWLAKSK